MKSFYRSISFVLLSLVTFVTFANDGAPDYVKKSNSGICHDKASAFYERTKNFQMYATMENCIVAGGRAHRSFKDKDFVEPIVDNSNKYNRKDWKHWSDSDRDCQDTRAEILIEQSKTPVRFSDWRSCYVTTGTWHDPYSGKTYTDDDDLDIDHIVPLGYAHPRGGKNWSAQKKEQFANDHDNLLAVQNSLNRQKSAKGPSEWMPLNQSYRCEYLARFDAIVTEYGLTYFSSEKRVIDRMKNACGL